MSVKHKINFSLAICLLLILITVLTISKRNSTIQDLDSISKSKNKSHLPRIQVLLHILRIQCANEDVNLAQNTFMDLKQEWEYQDVVMLSKKHNYYFPSDSLIRLDS